MVEMVVTLPPFTSYNTYCLTISISMHILILYDNTQYHQSPSNTIKHLINHHGIPSNTIKHIINHHSKPPFFIKDGSESKLDNQFVWWLSRLLPWFDPQVQPWSPGDPPSNRGGPGPAAAPPVGRTWQRRASSGKSWSVWAHRVWSCWPVVVQNVEMGMLLLTTRKQPWFMIGRLMVTGEWLRMVDGQ